MDLLLLYRLLLRKIWVLIIIPVIIVVLTFFVTAQMPSNYKSTAQLSTGFTTEGKIQVSEQETDLRKANVRFSNMIETVNSELILNMVSYKLFLHDWQSGNPYRSADYTNSDIIVNNSEKQEYLKVIKAKYDKMEVLSPYDTAENRIIEILGSRGYLNWQLKKDLVVERVGETDFVRIQFLSHNPNLSAFVVNTVAEEYIRYENSSNEDFSNESVEFFAKQVKEKQDALDRKTAAYNAYLKSNGLSNYTAESEANIEQINKYEVMQEETEAEIQRLRLSIEHVNDRIARKSTSGEQSGNSTGSAINSRIIDIKDRIEKLTELYRDSNLTDTVLENSIKQLRYQLQVEMNRLDNFEQSEPEAESTSVEELKDERDDMELNLKVQNQKLRSLRSKLGSMKSQVSGYASKGAAMDNLKREMNQAANDLDQAQERYNRELNKASVYETSVKIIQRGKPSAHPESSNRYIIIAMAGIASFIFCGFVITALEFMDPRLKFPEQFRRITNLRLLGSIPQVTVKGLELKTLFNANLPKKGGMDALKHFLRKFRYTIEDDPAQIYLITSNKKREGKSFIILSLAFTLSLIKRRILIIDTNFKNNSLTRALMPGQSGGKKLKSRKYLMSGVGNGRNQPDYSVPDDADYLKNVVTPTANKRIFLIGNSGEKASPSEIFADRDFNKMINYLKTQYDYILMEGPALNEYSDTQELGAYTERIIPVFSADSEIKQIDKESMTFLLSLNGKLLGAVLNKVNLRNLNL